MDGIAVGIDGSAGSMIALEWAADEACSRGLGLHLITALGLAAHELPYPPPSLHELRVKAEERGQSVLQRAVARAQAGAPGLRITGVVLAGEPVRGLLDASAGCEQLVVGCRGLNPIQDILLGSVSTAMVDHADCPVVVVRSASRAGPEAPVVAGIDGSDRDEEVLAAAFDAAARHLAPLSIVHGWSDLSAIERWCVKYPAVQVTASAVAGNPGSVLLDHGRTAGLLVVGSRYHAGVVEMLLGSVARRLIHHAACPVLVVRRTAAHALSGDPGSYVLSPS